MKTTVCRTVEERLKEGPRSDRLKTWQAQLAGLPAIRAKVTQTYDFRLAFHRTQRQSMDALRNGCAQRWMSFGFGMMLEKPYLLCHERHYGLGMDDRYGSWTFIAVATVWAFCMACQRCSAGARMHSELNTFMIWFEHGCLGNAWTRSLGYA